MRILFSGDICFSGAFKDNLEAELPVFSPAVRELLSQQDYCVANLEGPAISEELKETHSPKISNPEKAISRLTALNFSVANLANNHTFDAGEAGFHHCRDLLRKANMQWFGAGENRDSASRAIFLDSNGIRVALIGGSFREGPLATSTSAGVFHPKPIEFLLNRLQELANKVDAVILCYHGEEEYTTFPLPARRRWLHTIAETGLVNAIICHHPHVVQGWETIKDVPIYYSLGNTVFDVPNHYLRSYTDIGLLVELEIASTGLIPHRHFISLDRVNGLVSILPADNLPPALQNLGNFSGYSFKWQADAFRVFKEERFRPNDSQAIPATTKEPTQSFWAAKLLRTSFYQSLFTTLRHTNSRSIFFAAIRHWIRKFTGI